MTKSSQNIGLYAIIFSLFLLPNFLAADDSDTHAGPETTVATEDSVLDLTEVSAASANEKTEAGKGDGDKKKTKTVDDRVKDLESQVKKFLDADKKKKDEANKFPTAKFTMQLQADAYQFGQDELNRKAVGDIQDGYAFRRARFGWLGEYRNTEYRIEMDFALAGRPSFLDVWAGFKKLPYFGMVRAGHFFEPFSLERLTPNRFVTFLERSLPDQPFAPARNLGIASYHVNEEQTATWAIGTFRTDSDVFGDDITDVSGQALTTRGTWLPYYDDECEGRYYVHLGMGYSFRQARNKQVQFRSQPEARTGNAVLNNVPFFVNTGIIPSDYYQLLGLEAAWVHGPFSLQSEYMAVPVDEIGTTKTLWFQAMYVTASFFLTGEHRPYRKAQGVFDRVKPKRDFIGVPWEDRPGGGWGAWEIASRISYLDLNYYNIQGGQLTDWTIGLNWYINPYARLSLNYIRAGLDSPTYGATATDIVGARVNYDF